MSFLKFGSPSNSAKKEEGRILRAMTVKSSTPPPSEKDRKPAKTISVVPPQANDEEEEDQNIEWLEAMPSPGREPPRRPTRTDIPVIIKEVRSQSLSGPSSPPISPVTFSPSSPLPSPNSLGDNNDLGPAPIYKPARPPPPQSFSFDMRLPIYDRSNSDMTEIPSDVFGRTYLTKVHLFRNQLTSLPADIGNLVELEVLDLSHNKLSVIPKEICQLRLLQELHLVGNTACVFPEDLSNLTSLTFLDLMSNKLTHFPLALTTLPAIKKLQISRNQLAYLPIQIRDMKSLTFLDLAENSLKAIPKHLGSLTNLTTLKLAENHLEDLPKEIGNLSQLQELDLRSNHIRDIPTEIAKLVQLVKLDLSLNRIENIPLGIFRQESDPDGKPLMGLMALQEFKLKDNRIENLPDELGNLSALQILDLTANRISKIGSALSQLTNLAHLHLGFNKIQEISGSLGTLSYLETLNLFGNQLENIPYELTSLSALSKLNLGYNNLKDLPITSSPQYLEWENLEELYISGNPEISKFGSAFGNLWALKEIHAGNCGITEISGSAIEQLTSLQRLDLAWNKIQEIPTEISKLTDLQRLIISENSLKTLPPIIDQFPVLEELDISSNEISEIPETQLSEMIARDGEVYMSKNPCVQLENQLGIGEIKLKHENFKLGWSEMTGRRPTMEDAFLMVGNFRENSDLLGIFDGHAGNAAARFSAKHFATVFTEALDEHGDVVNAMMASFKKINQMFREFIKTQDINVKHCGSTALVSYISENQIFVGNLGDTRAVLCRGGKSIRISWEHKPMEEESRINALGGWVIGVTTRRINGMVAVARAIGDFFMEPFIIAEPFIGEYDLMEEDEFLILACDGVWDEIPDQMAVDIVRSEKDVNKACLKLRDYAYAMGSDDNISVIVVQFK